MVDGDDSISEKLSTNKAGVKEMIECKDLIKIYHDEENNIKIPALRGCDLKVGKGEILTIIGPSGSGKTTLINILAGLEPISSGTAHVCGFTLEKLTEAQLNNYRLQLIGIVDQFPERTLFLDGTVIDNLDFASNLLVRESPIHKERNRFILEKLGILHLENRIVRLLSGGEIIRTAVAAALAKNAPILLCDEPTGQLDSVNTEKVKNFLKQITREFGVTVLVVTHDPRFQEDVDKTCEIIDGRVSTILGIEEQLTYSGKTKFPLRFKSRLDSTHNIRIPEIIVKTLKLEDDVDLLLSKKSKVELVHPDKVSPEEIALVEVKGRRKTLKVDSLPENYHANFDIIIQMRNVSKTYPINDFEVEALTNINLDVHRGEMLFILGPSGSGKTTLVKLLTGLESPTAGEIHIEDALYSDFTDSQKADFRRRKIGLVSQQGNLHPFLTIEENFYLKEIYSGKSLSPLAINDKVESFLETFEILHRKNAYPLEISGGELQRASLAIANNDEPSIICLDEPTANLDSELAKQVMERIYSLHEKSNITFVIATHDIDLIRDGIRIIELIDGRIHQDGLVSTK